MMELPKKFRGIHAWIYALVCALFVSLAVAVLFSVIQTSRRRLIREAFESIETKASIIDALWRKRVRDMGVIAGLLSGEPKIIAVLATPDIDTITIHDVSDSIRESVGMEVLIFMDANGRAISISVDRRLDLTPESRSALSPTGVEGAYLKLADSVVLAVSAPVGVGGQAVGYVTVAEFVTHRSLIELKNMLDVDIALVRLDPRTGDMRLIGATLETLAPDDLSAVAIRMSDTSTVLWMMPSTGDEFLMRSFSAGSGVMVVSLKSLSATKAATATLAKRIVLVVTGMLIISIIILHFVVRTVSRPIRMLAAETDTIGHGGNFSLSTDISGPAEVSQLGRAVDNMGRRIKALLDIEKNAKENLEQRVKDRTQELEAANRQIKEQQAQMLQAEKMAGFGVLAAGIAHEINNPTGFIQSNLTSLKGYMADLAMLIEMYQRLKSTDHSPEADELRRRIDELEKKSDIPFLLEDIPDLLKDSIEGAGQIRKIVASLKDFARQDTGEFESVDLNNLIEKILTIAWNEIKYAAEVVRQFGDLPNTVCNSQQIGQAFMNILVNAAQAVSAKNADGKKGTITIVTRASNGCVVAEISDTGIGMPPQVIQKIFDPFFTTKPQGKGTGLGLHITHKIITSHGGRIEVDSEPAKGTTFRIILPLDAAALAARPGPD